MLAVLASPVCPLQQEVLRQPLLGRITAFIRMQYRVRDCLPARSCHAEDLLCGEPQGCTARAIPPGSHSNSFVLADFAPSAPPT